jgi:phage baseplate assembly protein W
MATTLTNLYSDLDFTFNLVPGSKDVARSFDDQAVIRSVRNLLLTNFYERPFQPNIGGNIDKLLFEPATNLTASLIKTEIENVITNYEPRVQIEDITVTGSVDENSFTVNLTFYIGNNTLPTSVNLLLERSR